MEVVVMNSHLNSMATLLNRRGLALGFVVQMVPSCVSARAKRLGRVSPVIFITVVVDPSLEINWMFFPKGRNRS